MLDHIFGEWVSFSTKDGKLLTDSLKSHDDLVRYWAFQDLREISKDPLPQRRMFIFRDGGEVFANLTEGIKKELDLYTKANTDLADTPALSAPIYTLAAPMSFAYAAHIIQKEDVFGLDQIRRSQGFRKFWLIATLPFRSSRRAWSKYRRTLMHVKLEAKLIQEAIIVRIAVEAAVRFLLQASKEDTYGVVQAKAEVLLEAFIEALKAAQMTTSMGLETRPYYPEWSEGSLRENLFKTERSLDQAIQELFDVYSHAFNLDLLEEENQEIAKIYRE